MGRYMRFENSVGFEVLARYTNFMHNHRQLYDGAVPWADAAIVLPRQSVLARRPDALDAFRDLGQALVERQVLLDVVVDQHLSAERLSQYPAVVLPKTIVLSDEQLDILRKYSANGGLLLSRGETGSLSESGRSRQDTRIKNEVKITLDSTTAAADSIVDQLRDNGATVIECPWTVRAAAYTQTNRVILHLVNYDRDEESTKGLKGPELERPKAVTDVSVRLRMPADRRATSVMLHTPDQELPTTLAFQSRGGHMTFTVPEIKVYAVISVNLKSR